MFTGLVETTGAVAEMSRGNSGVRLGIVPRDRDFAVAPGDSVCVSGVCLTLEENAGERLIFTAVAETLGRSTLSEIRLGAEVNLERALRLSDRIGGHFVLGHVDGVGRIVSDRRTGESLRRSISVPGELMPLMAVKGSVAIDGISLTIAGSSGAEISVALVPYTLEKTTLMGKGPGDRVNIECDVLARYVIHSARYGAGDTSGEPLDRRLERLGF